MFRRHCARHAFSGTMVLEFVRDPESSHMAHLSRRLVALKADEPATAVEA
jgi:hypothetical protein